MTSGGKIMLARVGHVCVLKFTGDVRLSLAPTLTTFVNSIGQASDCQSIVIDLTDVEGIDSTMLGLLAKISLRSQEALNRLPTIISTREDITRILLSMGFDSIFAISGEAGEALVGEAELAPQLVSEEEMREQVIDAHRTLMSLNESNEKAFHDLVESLESERHPTPPRVRAVR